MFKNSSIKLKLLSTVIGLIILVSIILLIESIHSLKVESEVIIKDTENAAYKTKEAELENYVSLAYKTLEKYYSRTSKDKIRNEVQEYITEQSDYLFSIINAEYERNKDTISQDELKERIKLIIQSTKYGKSGYFWINDFDYKMIMHPIKKELSGKYFKNTPKVPFVELGVNELKNSGKNKGFIEYSFYNPSTKKTVFKSSIVKVFKPYNWIIGTGAYIDDISEKMKKEALEAIKSMRYGKKGYFWVNNSEPKMLMHPIKEKLIGRDLSEFTDAKGKKHFIEMVKISTKNKNGGIVEYFWNSPKDKKDYKKFSYVKRFEPWDMIIGTGELVKDIENKVKELTKKTDESIKEQIFETIIIILAVLILGGLLSIYLMQRIIIKPLINFQNGLLGFFKYLNKEEESINLLKVESNDEIGEMTTLINKNIDKTKTIIEQDNILINDVKEIVNQVGKGYLDKKITSSTNNESLEELKSLLNDMLENLQTLVGNNINALSDVLAHYANRDFTKKIDKSTSGKIGSDIVELNKMITRILQDNQEDGIALQEKSNNLTSNVRVLNENASSQAASLEETAASIEEITSNIRQTSGKAQEMLDISSQTQNSANTGKDLANKTVKSMEEINETVMNISEAITVIDQIAFQTNILSLNAAVEAATAGEAGKGFAVVAQEVRNLAARSAEAAKEIKELVESATIKANDGKSISSSMIEGFEVLENKISETNILIDDVTNAAQEQTTGISQISDAVNQLDRFTQENASIADKTNNIALETNEIAKDIVDNVNANNFDGKS